VIVINYGNFCWHANVSLNALMAILVT